MVNSAMPTRWANKIGGLIHTMLRLLLTLLLLCGSTNAFTMQSRSTTRVSTPLFAEEMNRRAWFQVVTVAATGSWLTLTPPSLAIIDMPVPVEMKKFVDPIGLFEIMVPKRFFSLRRSAKGDLPDEKTGQGRRGSSIFTSGDMAKAEVVAVERFPARVLLEENGIDGSGDLSTFTKIGLPMAIANLLVLRRERDKPGQSNTQIVDAQISENGKLLSFQLRAEIDVQKPELLMEEFGIDRLFRITVAKASLESNDGQILAVFASALEQDYQGPDGQALRDAVESFVALDQSVKTAAL